MSQLLAPRQLPVNSTNVIGDAMIIPEVELTAFRVKESPEHVDMANSRFNQSPCHQKTLPVFVAAVTITNRLRLRVEEEGASDSRIGEQTLCLLHER